MGQNQSVPATTGGYGPLNSVEAQLDSMNGKVSEGKRLLNECKEIAIELNTSIKKGAACSSDLPALASLVSQLDCRIKELWKIQSDLGRHIRTAHVLQTEVKWCSGDLNGTTIKQRTSKLQHATTALMPSFTSATQGREKLLNEASSTVERLRSYQFDQ